MASLLSMQKFQNIPSQKISWVNIFIYLVGHWLFIKGKTQKALTRAKDRNILLLCFMSYVKPSLSRKSINCTASNITLAGDSGYPNSLQRQEDVERSTVNQWLHANTSETLMPDKWWFLMLGWCNYSEFNRGHTLLFTDSKCCRGSISYLLLCHNTHLFRKMCNKRSGWQFQPRF